MSGSVGSGGALGHGPLTLQRLADVDWWLVLVTVALAVAGLMAIHSATLDDTNFSGHATKQSVYLLIGTCVAAALWLVSLKRLHASVWWIYAAVVVSLLLLPFLGSQLNGARRWYRIPGLFGVQPSEFAKLAVVLALAGWYRLRGPLKEGDVGGRRWAPLWGALLLTAVPALLIFRQPDLGSSLVFWPVLFAVSYAAGVPAKRLGWLGLAGLGLFVVAWFLVLHDYQKMRVLVWMQHFTWDAEALGRPDVQAVLRAEGYQPWQALIAIGSGGWSGFGYLEGPQSRFDFLPYRDGDYVFAVVAEELGLLGSWCVLALIAIQIMLLFAAADRTRERFGRLVLVGVGTWIGAQTLMHVAVCTWLAPATGLPMPFVSHGGSSAVALLLAVGVCVNVTSRRSPVLSGDGFRLD